MKLGVDNYSLRFQKWDAFEMLQYLANLGVDNAHFSDMSNFRSLEDDYLLSVKQRAEELGLDVEVGMGSFDQFSRGYRQEDGPGEKKLANMLKISKTMGSPSVRCFLGSQFERQGELPIEAHIEECLRVLNEVAPIARDLGVYVAIENHGGIDLLARELEQLVVAAGKDFVGVCLDTGNPAYAAEDPVLATEILAPYAVTSHFRDTRVWAVEDGAMVQWAPMGEGSADFPKITEIFRQKAPNAAFVIEVITGGAPRSIPYFKPESDFWKMYPNMLAQDFARFVALANKTTADGTKAQPFEQVTTPPGQYGLPEGELGEKLVAQQRRHLEESVRYCQDVLGVGERGRK